MKLKIIKLKKVKSTNDEAIKLINKNKVQPTILTAVSQKKGRGTMGKKWVSKKGNLFISIFFEFNSKKIDFKIFSILNAYIVKKILNKYSKSKIIIKWPNDLLIAGKKICGILQEVIEFNDKKYLIIGIGINSLHNPNNKSFKSTSLKKISNRIIDNTVILNDIILAYEKFLSDIRKYKISYLKRSYCKD